MKAFRKRVTWLAIIMIVTINLLAVTSTAVYACSCAPPESPREEIERSTAVFAGKVTEIDVRNDPDAIFDTPVKVTFQVSEVWKGPVQTTLVIQTGFGGGDCGYRFDVGKEYLIYTYGSEPDLKVSSCSRTAPLTMSAEDLIALGTGVIPAPDSTGNVTWLPALFFGLLGLFLIMTGLFAPQLNRHLGMDERSQLFTHPRFRRSARKMGSIVRIVQILLGLGFLMQGIGNSFYAHEILNVFSFLLLGLAGIGILVIFGMTIRNWRA